MEPHPQGDAAELLREVLEARNQAIKTANAVTGLAAEIRELKQAQQRGESGRKLGSLVTYAALLAAVIAGFYFTHRARQDRADLEHEQLARQQQAAQARVRELERQIAQREQSAGQAYAFYRLLRRGQTGESLARYEEVARLPLSRVEAELFRDEVTRHRNRLAFQAYNAGVRAIADKDWGRAAEELRRSLTLLPEPPHAAPLHFQLGLALTRLGNYSEAAEEMERALAAGAEQLVSREVRYQLGTVYEQLGARGKARAAYQQYLRGSPSGALARAARARLKALAD